FDNDVPGGMDLARLLSGTGLTTSDPNSTINIPLDPHVTSGTTYHINQISGQHFTLYGGDLGFLSLGNQGGSTIAGSIYDLTTSGGGAGWSTTGLYTGNTTEDIQLTFRAIGSE